MASSPMIGGSDPAILKSLETQTPLVARTAPATVSATTGSATSSGSTVSRGLVPQVSGDKVVYNQATQSTSGNSVSVTSSTSNDPGDIVTIYTSPKTVSVSAINQTVNTYKVNNYAGNEYTDSNVANYLPTFTGNLGAGNVNVTGTVYSNGLSSTGLASLTTLNVSTTANLGAVGNVRITGGTSGQVLSTDGSGVLSWINNGGGGSAYGNSNVAAYLPTYTGNIGGDVVSANLFVGNGANLTNIPAGNISGAIGLATYATTANSVAGANVSGAVSYATTANAVAGANVSGEVAYAATANSVAGANVSGAVSYATTANAVAGANVSGEVAYAATANAVAGANVSGAVSYASTANAVALANVSGAGNIASINLDGNVSNVLAGDGTWIAAGSGSYGNSDVATFLASYGSNTITTTGNVSVGNIVGNGQALTGIAGANVTGTVANANLSQYLNVSNVSDNFSYHVVLSAGDGDKSLHIDATDNLQYNPNSGLLTAVRMDADYFIGNLNFSNGYPAANLVGSMSSIANGNSNVSIATANGNVTINSVGNTTMTITGTGANVTGTLTSTGKIGYASGSSVTQITSRGTGVTINALAGTVVTVSATMVAGQIDTFTVANDQVDPNNDIVLVQIVSPNFGVYNCIAQPSATISSFLNGFYINIQNISGFTTTSDAITIRFMVIKAPNA